MNVKPVVSGAAVFAVLLGGVLARGEDITVQPGKGTISKSLERVKPGDVVRLLPGRYEDELDVPEGITLLGSGVESTVVVGTDEFATVSLSGPDVEIRGIEFRPGEKSQRGVDSSFPVRIEKCRFVGYQRAVLLSFAPLSDVVHCEFIKCDVGIAPLAEASPTIWGCLFQGGKKGILCVDGSPYIRNNLFYEQEHGIFMAGRWIMIVRNNVFWRCKESGVEIMGMMGRPPMASPIRNNVFANCGAAILGEPSGMSAVSHCVLHDVGRPPFRNEKVEVPIDLSKNSIVVADPKLRLGKDGGLVAGNPDVLRNKGVRLASEPKAAVGDIGLTVRNTHPGCRPPKDAEVPARRFDKEPYVSNSISEERALLSMWNLSFHRSGHGKGDRGEWLGFYWVMRDGKEVKITFDTTRYQEEMLSALTTTMPHK